MKNPHSIVSIALSWKNLQKASQSFRVKKPRNKIQVNFLEPFPLWVVLSEKVLTENSLCALLQEKFSQTWVLWCVFWKVLFHTCNNGEFKIRDLRKSENNMHADAKSTSQKFDDTISNIKKEPQLVFKKSKDLCGRSESLETNFLREEEKSNQCRRRPKTEPTSSLPYE